MPVSFTRAEWIEYSRPNNLKSSINFSTSSLVRLDDTHYGVTVFTNYPTVQSVEINKRKIQFQSKSQIQYFGCETQDFALGDYELYPSRDAVGSKAEVHQNEIIWNPITQNSLQMEFLKQFCKRS
jgi:hypothetical protein